MFFFYLKDKKGTKNDSNYSLFDVGNKNTNKFQHRLPFVPSPARACPKTLLAAPNRQEDMSELSFELGFSVQCIDSEKELKVLRADCHPWKARKRKTYVY